MKKKIIISLFIVLLLFNIYNFIYDSLNQNYIMFDTNTILNYNKGKITKIKRLKKANMKMNYEKFKVYNKGNFESIFLNFENNETTKLYNEENEIVDISGPLLMYHGDVNLKIMNLNEDNELLDEDKEMIGLRLLKKYNINENFDIFKKYNVDLNNDSLNEQLYYVSNFSSSEYIYYYIFLKESNGNIIDIAFGSEDYKKLLTFKKGMISWIIDFEDDKNFEIVISNTIGEQMGRTYDFYQYKDGKVKKIYN